jgi:hypothetical protein
LSSQTSSLSTSKSSKQQQQVENSFDYGVYCRRREKIINNDTINDNTINNNKTKENFKILKQQDSNLNSVSSLERILFLIKLNNRLSYSTNK